MSMEQEQTTDMSTPAGPPSLDIFEPPALRIQEDSESLSEVLHKAQSAFRDSPRPSTLITSSGTASTLSAISVLSATSEEIILRFHRRGSTPCSDTAPGPPVLAHAHVHPRREDQGSEDGGLVLRLHSSPHRSTLPPLDFPGPPLQPLLQGCVEFAANFDFGKVLGQMGETMERAFWNAVMPAIGSLMGAGQGVTSAFTSFSVLPSNLAITASNPPNSAISGEGKGKEHLYAHETLYTLRLPPPILTALCDGASDVEKVDLGPTLQPIWVRKRAAIPEWSSPTYKSPWNDSWRAAGREAGLHKW